MPHLIIRPTQVMEYVFGNSALGQVILSTGCGPECNSNAAKDAS